MRYLTFIALCVDVFAQSGPTIGTCPVFPPDHIWNTPVDQLPVASNSATLITTVGANAGLKADFGSGLYNGGLIGIPFITVPGSQTKYPASFRWPDESDAGPYAVPLNAPIESGGDRHAISVDTDNCILYELYAAYPQSASWAADSGAIFNLRGYALRTSGDTSADAAGLPIMPGLARYDEVASGEIRHALRFTVPQTRRLFVWPARHYASSLTDPKYSRMGERFRLRANYDISTFSPEIQVILRALKKYGMMLADNGSAWFISGAPDERWNNDHLTELRRVLGSDLEAVDVSSLMIDPNSGQARQSGVISVTVTPGAATLLSGRTQQFSATVQNSTNQSVNWSVNGALGGSSAVGFIDTTGFYTAPTVASQTNFTIQAASVDAPTATGSATATVNPFPVVNSVSPSSIPIGSFTLTVTGSRFVNGARVTFAGSNLTTTFVSSTQLNASGSATTQSAAVPITVVNPDGGVSNTVNVSVVASAPVTVSVSPTSAILRLGRKKQFTATVQNTSNTAVTWLVNGVQGGTATDGTISPSGLYTAPNSMPNPSTVTITARSVADPNASGSATVRFGVKN